MTASGRGSGPDAVDPDDISIELLGLRIEFRDPVTAVATFEQRYASATYRDRVIKLLSLRRTEDDQWSIVAETVLEELPWTALEQSARQANPAGHDSLLEPPSEPLRVSNLAP